MAEPTDLAPSTEESSFDASRGFDRRTLLRGALATGLVVGVAGWVGGCADEETPAAERSGDPAGAEPTSGSTPAATEVDPIVALGQRYRSLHPEDDEEAQLRAGLGMGPDDELDDEILARFRDQARVDGALGQTMSLDGWVLSRTECRIAALISLA